MDIVESIKIIMGGRDLNRQEMSSVINQILTGLASDAQIGAFLVSLNIKGESIEEIIGAAEVMRSLSLKVLVDKTNLVDTCGTGGVGKKIFNVSTTAAFVASSCGAKVAKHGNRSVTRSSGSADLIENTGVSIDLKPEQVKDCIEKVGIGFMFAPAHHGAMKYAAGPRKDLAIKTIFNLLGPLTNPAGVKRQVIGVYDIKWVKPVAEVLKELGSEHVMVVHSEDGLDEISIGSLTNVAELKDGKIREYVISPEDFGFNLSSIDDLLVNSTKESLNLSRKALNGEIEAASNMISMNSGAALYVAGIANDIKEGVEFSQKNLKNGKAAQKLEELKLFTNNLQQNEK